jgi:hypothetical protein
LEGVLRFDGVGVHWIAKIRDRMVRQRTSCLYIGGGTKSLAG